MINAAVIGGSGYAGAELVRLLVGHPEVHLSAVTSERSAGIRAAEIIPGAGSSSLKFESLNLERISGKAEVFFLCLPHKASQDTVAFLHRAGKKVIDLSADYRLKRASVYKSWYQTPHMHTGLLKKAVYGMPEIHREDIVNASLIGNPGCYPTSAILALAPVIGMEYVNRSSIIVDSKSGTSGAGKGPAQPFMFCEVNESVRAYAIASHRHTPEIEQELSLLAGEDTKIVFTPHLIPMDRGILTTAYVPVQKKVSLAQIHKLYSAFYKDSPFVRVLAEGAYPATKTVKGTNYCDIAVFADNRPGKSPVLVIVSAIDNLIKGASGTAVHNMNLMYGFDETTGLPVSAPSP